MLTKLRFIEAGAINRYRKTWTNHFVYNNSICNPSTGLITLTTLAKQLVDDTLMYSEAISNVVWEDVDDADIVFITINSFNAVRGYEIADRLRHLEVEDPSQRPLVVLGGMHASLNYPEAVAHADYVFLGDSDESILEFIEVLGYAREVEKCPAILTTAGGAGVAVDDGERKGGGLAVGVDDGGALAAGADEGGILAAACIEHTVPAFAWPEEGPQVQIAGLAYQRITPKGTCEAAVTASRPQPCDIDTIPDRTLVYDYARMAKSYDTLWPQVHASRGCTGTCDYCCVIAHFGRKIRTRSPESVVEDIRQSIALHSRSFPPRFTKAVWLTDDNFALNRAWAKSVLQAIIDSDIDWPITVQAHYELGFDEEMLALMKQANFFEVSLGIEFIDDASFVRYHKRCTRERIEQAIANIQAHGIGVRGLFILGSDEDTPGVGKRLGQFIIDNNIHGCLIQSMFFIPGTPVYEQNKDRLLHHNWDLFNGNVVHQPENMTPAELQQEMIDASATAYSPRRLLHALLHAKGVFKILFIGETFWHAHLRRTWRKRLPELRAYDTSSDSFMAEAGLPIKGLTGVQTDASVACADLTGVQTEASVACADLTEGLTETCRAATETPTYSMSVEKESYVTKKSSFFTLLSQLGLRRTLLHYGLLLVA